MIVSFFPGYSGDKDFFQFEPITSEILEAMINSKGVVFPPTVSPEIYFFAKSLNVKVFPEYTLRFKFPGKIGQILLLKSFNLPHPETVLIPRLCGIEENPYSRTLKFYYPFVLKGNWGNEGSEVFLVRNEEDLKQALKCVKAWERNGRFGFLVQEYIDSPFDARAIIIGKEVFVFFRKGGFKKNLVQEGEVIPCPKPGLKKRVKELAEKFASLTGFNLVAVDFLFKNSRPLISEFNFVFGRRLIGEKKYKRALTRAIKDFFNG